MEDSSTASLAYANLLQFYLDAPMQQIQKAGRCLKADCIKNIAYIHRPPVQQLVCPQAK